MIHPWHDVTPGDAIPREFAAIITPGGDIPTMLMLTAPLCGLYELGIWLATLGKKRAKAVT